VRLAVPRRLYTDAHLDYVVDRCVALLLARDAVRGLRIVSRAPVLPHFTAQLEPVEEPVAAGAGASG
jgi:tryptophanase